MKIAGINFDHFHMGDLLRFAFEHPNAEIVGISDESPERMQSAAKHFGIPEHRVYTDYRKCLEETKPDVVILCPATAKHAEWVEKIAPYDIHMLVEKPFAASLAEADRMIAAMHATGKQLVINWPLVWVPSHRTAKRLIDEGTIGQVIEVRHYGGNRGPLYHLADKLEVSEAEVQSKKADSWFYKKSQGGGSLLDYMGYGSTLGTWYHNGRVPIEVTTVVNESPDIEVDEHSLSIVRYDVGLSKIETRWGTFTDPWTTQTQPKCGFEFIGTDGTLSSYDYEQTVAIQTRARSVKHEVPVDNIEPPFQNPVQYFIHCLETETPITGPLSIEISRIGQQIVDTAVLSANEKRTVKLIS
ncbi:MAG: Gfo/Idh/MocA family oxidoreductase [Pirellulaceae bacterium]|nr:Gfo/Idh/MocA family oxidoreductase [Pirellulaceae bacterium]